MSGSKSSAKRLRKGGIIGAVQAVLVEHAEANALSKLLVLAPAKQCLGDLWFGAKRKKLR